MSQQAKKTNDIRVSAFKDGQYKAGIFTGYSYITNNYHVSFFDGSTGRYICIESILFDETDNAAPPNRALELRNESL